MQGALYMFQHLRYSRHLLTTLELENRQPVLSSHLHTIERPLSKPLADAAFADLEHLVALQALRDHGGVRAGQKVLINGASGGIGTFAVQIAKALGAEVTGVCSTRNVDMVRSIGADHVIDYTREDFTHNDRRYDFILDNVANHSLSGLRRALTPTGTLVPNGGGFDNRWFANGGRVISAHVLKRFVGHRLRPFLVSPKVEDLAVLTELFEAGKVTPVIERTYPLSETPEAIGHVGGGRARGKIAVTVGHTSCDGSGVVGSNVTTFQPGGLPRPVAMNRRIPDGSENHGVPGSNPGPATLKM
jgi:NADPH:quinone reductase-like Zn-dependent oxidoreductase